MFKRYGLQWFEEAVPSASEVAGEPPLHAPYATRALLLRLNICIRIQRIWAGRPVAPHEQVALQLPGLPALCAAHRRAVKA